MVAYRFARYVWFLVVGCRTFAMSLVRQNLLVGVGKLFPTCTKKNSYV